jgi:SAM-dependent methyltransferase
MPLPRTSPAAQDDIRHPLFARAWVRYSPRLDARTRVGEHRSELLTGLRGRVVEVGAGNGLNFARYPQQVTEVVAVEPERRLRQCAVEAALASPARIDVLPGRAEALPLPDASFDAAVLSLVLCSVRDAHKALAEVARVLRPGGELRFYEHGRGGGRGMRRVQSALDRTLWPRLCGGCHTGRDPVALIEAAGFDHLVCRRMRVPEAGPPLPTSFHVLGSARLPN